MQILLALFLLLPSPAASSTGGELPVIRSTQELVTIRDGANENRNGWRLSPETNPDVYEAQLIDGKPHEVAFITDVDAIRFMVELGKSYDFVIDWNGKRCVQRIVGTRFVAPAVFDAKYRTSNRGSLRIEIPELYELVNVALALTPTGIANKNLVYQQGDYYRGMRAWFDAHQAHPFVTALEESLKRNPDTYNNLKMNAYTFAFARNGKIVKRKEFDRTGWGRTNALDPLLAKMQSFADQTRFRKFFRANKATYDAQIAFYRERANVPEMLRWLNRNFPGAKPYDSYRVIFSPLVAYNQSANWFESNGFRELHAHVNFAYEEDVKRYSRGAELTRAGETVIRGNIAFTELNHGYINPEADKYAERILKAIAARDYCR